MWQNAAVESNERHVEPQGKETYLPEDENRVWRWRGVHWRVMLGVLPHTLISIEELRQTAANGRRRYAELRRRILVDPHILEEVQKTNRVGMDNPLSQDPESIWGRYFQNAELERTIENDLTRLYPEHEIFFQSPVCQAILRRILLVWSLIHPNYSYRQGMHELLAPLVYVLYVDALHFCELKRRYKDLFDDRFDNPSDEEPGGYENGRTRKAACLFSHKSLIVIEGCKVDDGDEWTERISPRDSALLEADEFGFDLRTMVLGSDIYGTEGELGAILSGRFVEHDAYCMFDALMNGHGGAVAMAEYFMNSNGSSLSKGMSPVLEASVVLYRALAAADGVLHRHLVALRVEPQFFALRWLRVLFGREFIVEKLFILWDAIFLTSNTILSIGDHDNGDFVSRFSQRGAFISAVAVSMLLYLRPTLLAAADATSCLQRLLNFPQSVDVRSLIENAKMLQPLAEDAIKIMPSQIMVHSRSFDQTIPNKLLSSRCVSLPSQGHKKLCHQNSCSPELPKYSPPESYWEEKWKSSMLQKASHDTIGAQSPKTGKAICHSKLVPRDLIVDTLGRMKDKERQESSVREMLYAVNVNKTVRSKNFDGSGQTGKNKYSSQEEPLGMPLNLGIIFDSEQQGLGDTDTTLINSKDSLHLEGTDLIPASSPEHLLTSENTTLVPAGSVMLQHTGKDGTNNAEDFEVGFPALIEETTIEHDDLSSAFSNALDSNLEDRENMRSNSPTENSKGSRTSRFFRLWNFTRNQIGDRKSVQKKDRALSAGSTRLVNRSKTSNVTRASPEDCALKARHEMCSCNEMAGDDRCIVQNLKRNVEEQTLLYESSITKGCQCSLKPRERNEPFVSQSFTELSSDKSAFSLLSNERGSTVLQMLGRSMLDDIQVLEIAFSQQLSMCNKESSIDTIPILKGTLKTSLSKKDQIAALQALVDLRRISNFLLQM